MTAITSEAFARQLADLGIITADLNTVERVTITAQGDRVLMIRVDQFGDDRLAQVVAEAQPETAEHLTGGLLAENTRLRALAAEILDSYIKTGGEWRGRVGQVQIARWRVRLDGPGADQDGGSR
jgi:hypothetical protein